MKSSPPKVLIDPFSRRYQVFVSSTFQDLKEERSHAMQAILEMNCIPSGMELFPAASSNQWELIKKVIDECDYYLVVVAGRYGSENEAGVSFTEAEFDYAAATGKHVLGFYHQDLEQLPGRNLEKSEVKRAKLERLLQKVKQRLCKSWLTPEALGSAIKSALMHAIREYPKPGWVRADDETLRAVCKTFPTPGTNETQVSRVEFWENETSVPALVVWDKLRTSSIPLTAGQNEVVYCLQWKEIFLAVAPEFGQPQNPQGMGRKFDNFLKRSSTRFLKEHAAVMPASVTVNTIWFRAALETMLSHGVLKKTRPPKHLRIKTPYWMLTSKGVKIVANLKALNI